MTSTGISVSELNQIIVESLHREARLRSVTVTAEISGFKNHFASGHWYFSLKDENAAIGAVMFRQNNLHARIRPRDGDRVTVSGYVEMYARDGRVQLYVLEMKPAGLGDLYEQFEALKRKLNEEGLFDPSRKRLLPQVPRKVAVITSASGAALHDILNVSGMRNPSIPIVVVPSAVQGSGAARELISAVEIAQRIPQVEIIILARGGGSPEDLWCFNDEALARKIAACAIPVVTGVGHEVDTTICDYVADFRASTPSNAAEVVFPDRSELRGRTERARTALAKCMSDRIHAEQLRVIQCRDRLGRLSPDRRIHDLLDRTHQSAQRLEGTMTLLMREKREALNRERARINYVTERAVAARQAELRQARTRLEAISPLKVLDRGYALVYDSVDRIVPDADSANHKGDMSIRFRDGRVNVIRKES